MRGSRFLLVGWLCCSSLVGRADESCLVPATCGEAAPSCASLDVCDPACGEPGCGSALGGYADRSGCCDSWLGPQNDCGESRFRMSGWLDAGFVGNTGSPNSRFNGPYNAVDRSNEPMFNQGYLISEIALPRDGFGVGGRIDLLYGEDYLLAQSVGMETHQNGSPHWNPQYYGFAIPQAYVEVGGPRLSTKFGHFYSIVGYEGLPAVNNFFYSKSYSYQFAGPFTHWGALTTYKLTDRLQFQGGLTNGWNGLDRTTDRMGILAGAKYSADCWWTSFAITAGDEDNNPAGLPGVAPTFANRSRYSWLVGLTLTDRLDYVFHHWLGLQDNALTNGQTAQWYGIDQYLTYTLNCRWKAGARFEWFRDQNGTRVGLNRSSNPNNPPFVGNFYSLSFGLNHQPTKNVTIRPEIRSDWYTGDSVPRPYQDGAKTSQLMLGVDAIYQF